MTVQVTERHIAHGFAEDCHFCPVALALQQALANYLEPALGKSSAQFIAEEWSTDGLTAWGNGGINEFPLPEGVGEWVNQFDGGLPVEPFRFEISEEQLPATYREMAAGRLRV